MQKGVPKNNFRQYFNINEPVYGRNKRNKFTRLNVSLGAAPFRLFLARVLKFGAPAYTIECCQYEHFAGYVRENWIGIFDSRLARTLSGNNN